jgi:2-polyprenyl-3-methyl-5-hydroxy-6-metoxy-1,4-benzoquinol methylase
MMERCPICGCESSDKLFPQYRGKCITSQMFFVKDIELDNRCCTRCGFIFNMKGIRGKEEEVYNEQTWKPKPQIVSFGKNVKTTHERSLDIFRSMVDLPSQGKLLDFGAGTGAFLKYFSQAFPGWELTAIEPGGGYAQLSENPKIVQAFNSPYYELNLSDEFDAVVVMSVLEHVADPLGALRWIHRRLKPGGVLLMQHPNFALLPGDLFCADHINKMTVPYTRELCESVGFNLLAEDTELLPFYFALSKGQAREDALPNCYAQNSAIAAKCEHIAQRTLAAVEAAVKGATGKKKSAAIFGTSPIGSMAHLVLGCKQSVACFVDENKNVWGREIDDLPVIGPEKMAEMGVSDLALAVSPLYWEMIEEKMRRFGVDVHVPEM